MISTEETDREVQLETVVTFLMDLLRAGESHGGVLVAVFGRVNVSSVTDAVLLVAEAFAAKAVNGTEESDGEVQLETVVTFLLDLLRAGESQTHAQPSYVQDTYRHVNALGRG